MPDDQSMTVVPSPRLIWAAVALMALCMTGYIIVGASAVSGILQYGV
jgi:hypothetical protein